MNKSFLNAVHQGKTHWWLYCLVILGIGLYWWFLGGYIGQICHAIFSLIFNSRYINFFIATYINFFIATSTPFIVLLAILVFAIKRLHCRKFYSLVNADSLVNTKRLLLGFAVWGLQLFFFTLYEILVYPQSYMYTFDPEQWFILLPFALILIPIQTSTEEFLYRGYLMQGLSLITKHPFILMLITSLAFAVPHFGNPEMHRGVVWVALTYFIWGVFFAAITLKDGSIVQAMQS